MNVMAGEKTDREGCGRDLNYLVLMIIRYEANNSGLYNKG